MNKKLQMACLAAAVITGLVPVVASPVTASAAPVRPAASATVNWPGFHDNAADTGYNPSETTLGPGNVAGLSQQWLASTTGSVAGDAPTIANGHAYSSSYTSVSPSQSIQAVQEWNASTGAAGWTVKPPVPVSSPAFGDGRLFVSSDFNGDVYAYNATTGKLSWTVTQPEAGGDFEPVYSGGLVYVTGYFSVSAYNAATGAQVWRTSVDGLVAAVPSLSDGRLFVAISPTMARQPQNLYALNSSTGALLWRAKTGMSSEAGSPVATSDMVYLCVGATLYARWAKSGDQRWTDTDGCGSGTLPTDNTPALANGVLYTAGGGSGDVTAVNAATGAVDWNVAGTGSEGAPPAVANGVVYVPMQAGTIAAYGVSSGALLWTSPDLGFSGTEPAVVNGLLYMDGSDGLYAFGLGG